MPYLVNTYLDMREVSAQWYYDLWAPPWLALEETFAFLHQKEAGKSISEAFLSYVGSVLLRVFSLN